MRRERMIRLRFKEENIVCIQIRQMHEKNMKKTTTTTTTTDREKKTFPFSALAIKIYYIFDIVSCSMKT